MAFAREIGTGVSMQDKSSFLLPAVVVGVATVFFLLFVYGYPRLFPEIEASNPDHFEQTVADAVMRGDLDKALRVAARESERRPNDPAAHTAYGRALLASGRPAEAVEQLGTAVTICQDLEKRATRKPFCFAPARLALGQYHLDKGRTADAVVNFELARAYALLAGEQYADYHEAIYQAYSQQRLWARALEFRQPTDGELNALDVRDLELLGRVCEGEKDWALAERIAERLITHDAVEGRYLLGRAELARERYGEAAADLEQAASSGRVHAAFFLGAALEKAGQPEQARQAYMRAPSGDLYRPFALAKAVALLQTEGSETAATPPRNELLSQLDSEIAAMRQMKPPVPQDVYHRFTLVAFTASPLYFESGGRFPVLILWKDQQAPSAANSEPTLSVCGDSLVLRLGADTILQLQWVENELNWASVDLASAGAGEAPGWIDTARDWFSLRPDYAAHIENDAGNNYLSIDKMTWFYSALIPVSRMTGYVLAGRVKGPQKDAGLHWQALDDEEHVLAENTVYGDIPGAWDRSASYFRSQLDWDFARVELCVAPQAGPVAFDDVMLVEAAEPAGPLDSIRAQR